MFFFEKLHKNPVLYSVLLRSVFFAKKADFWAINGSFLPLPQSIVVLKNNFSKTRLSRFMRGYDKNIQKTRRRFYGRMVSEIRIENGKTIGGNQPRLIAIESLYKEKLYGKKSK